MNDANLINILKAVPEVRKYLLAYELEYIKSIETYDRQLWAYALDLYRGGDAGYFIDDFATAISNQLSRAWNEGAREVKIGPKDMDETDLNELQSIIDNEYEHVLDLATDIQNAQTLTLDEFRRQFRNRITLWVNRYKDTVDRAKIYFGGKTRLVWVLGKTEKHCASCSALNGIVAWAKEWEEAGVKPQNPPNGALECGGWNCDCSLEVTERRRSANALARILRVINIGKSVKYSPDQPRVPAGTPDGGQWTDERYTPKIEPNANNAGEFPPTDDQLEKIQNRIKNMPSRIRNLEPIDPKYRTRRKLNGDLVEIEDTLLVGIMPNGNEYSKPMGTAYSKANGLYINEEFIGTPIQDHEYIHTLLFRNKLISDGIYDQKYKPPYYFQHAEHAQNREGEQMAMLLTGYNDDEEKWVDDILKSDPGMDWSREDAKKQIVELSRFLEDIKISW